MTTAPYSPATVLDDERTLSSALDRVSMVCVRLHHLRSSDSSWVGAAHSLYLEQLARLELTAARATVAIERALAANRAADHG